jgi:hypothetical protein
MLKTIFILIGIGYVLWAVTRKPIIRKEEGDDPQPIPETPALLPPVTEKSPEPVIDKYYMIDRDVYAPIEVYNAPNQNIIATIPPLLDAEFYVFDTALDSDGYWWALCDIAYNGNLVVYKHGWIRTDYLELLGDLYQPLWLT